MTWRLVVGMTFVQRRAILSVLPMMAIFSRPASLPDWIAGSLILVMAVGSGTVAQSSLAMRNVVVLPVGTRDLHRAAWLLTAVLPLAMLTVARVLGGGWHTLFSDDGWMFHASAVRVIFECLYFGLIAAWVVMLPEHHQSNVLQDSWFLRKWLLLKLVGMAAMVALPFVVIPRLPATLSDVPPALWALAVGLLAVGLAPLLNPPAAYQRVSPPATSPAESLVRATRPSPTPPLVPSRFQGVWALLPGLAIRAFFLALVMIVFLVFVQHDKAAPTIWRPFDPSLTTLRFLTTIALPVLFLLGTLPGLGNRFSVLKMLPLSSGRAALILGLAPAATPVLFWIMLVIIHVAVTTQWPGTLRLGLLVAFIGAASLVDALGVKSGSPTMKFAMGASLLLTFTYGMDDYRAQMATMVDHWSLPIAGLVCLVLGVLVHLHTLTRSDRSSRVHRFGRTDAPQGAQ